jgi:hypothetical protein
LSKFFLKTVLPAGKGRLKNVESHQRYRSRISQVFERTLKRSWTWQGTAVFDKFAVQPLWYRSADPWRFFKKVLACVYDYRRDASS